MKKGASQNFTLPEEFPSIEDAEVIPGEECPVANIGEVEDWGDEVRHWVSVEYSTIPTVK